ncbi:MAG: hypothetical protein ABW321_19960 [Polyangiales bacterium]
MTSLRNEGPIGVFDSGVGGLTVLRALQERLPREDFVYLGDTARSPYGSRGRQTIINYAHACVRVLREQRIKLLVIADNTLSAVALEALAGELFLPVIGAIVPGAQAALMAGPGAGVTSPARSVHPGTSTRPVMPSVPPPGVAGASQRPPAVAERNSVWPVVPGTRTSLPPAAGSGQRVVPRSAIPAAPSTPAGSRSTRPRSPRAGRHIGVLTTTRTALSDAYPRAFRQIDSAVRVHVQKSPLLIPLVEEGYLDGELPRLVLREYLAPLLDVPIDTLLLGCSQYPLLIPLIEAELAAHVAEGGAPITLVDSAGPLADDVVQLIAAKNFATERTEPGKLRLMFTDPPEDFTLAKRCLGRDLPGLLVSAIDL